MLLFSQILLIVCAVFLFVLGIKFRQGKWLRLIAGNTFNDKPKEAKDIAPYVGILMYTVSGLLLVIVMLTWYFS